MGLQPHDYTAIDGTKEAIIREMFSRRNSGARICKELHISNTTLAKYKKKLGITGPYDAAVSQKTIQEIANMAEQGYMDTKIAKTLSLTRSYVQAIRKRNGIKSKFTYDKVSKIDSNEFEKLFFLGYSDKEIAERLRMSPAGIYQHRISHGYLRESRREASNNPLTQDNLEIILGILMGDGSLRKTNKNTSMSLAHCPKQKDYTFYIAEKLKNLNPHLHYHKAKPDYRTGKCYESYWCTLPSNPSLNTLYERFYKNGKKRIPFELFDSYTWQSLAYHFMDDGTKTKCAGTIATNCFSIEDLRKFKKFLKDKFDIETTICKSHILYIKAKSFKRMKTMIEPYMCDCMKYKVN